MAGGRSDRRGEVATLSGRRITPWRSTPPTVA